MLAGTGKMILIFLFRPIVLIAFKPQNFKMSFVCTFLVNIFYSQRYCNLKICQLIASDKFNLLRKVHFLLKIGYKNFIRIFISYKNFYSLGGRIPGTTVVKFVYNRARQVFSRHY